MRRFHSRGTGFDTGIGSQLSYSSTLTEEMALWGDYPFDVPDLSMVTGYRVTGRLRVVGIGESGLSLTNIFCEAALATPMRGAKVSHLAFRKFRHAGNGNAAHRGEPKAAFVDGSPDAPCGRAAGRTRGAFSEPSLGTREGHGMGAPARIGLAWFEDTTSARASRFRPSIRSELHRSSLASGLFAMPPYPRFSRIQWKAIVYGRQ